ncbi:MAG: D-glycero-alpha-D-manno-heptose-1,7-bisphosphate 7-phosphatase [Burkholderiales bacterium]
MRRRAVFLDRDGVINQALVRDNKPYPPDSLEELRIIPSVAEALERLRAAGFLNVIVTNQPDVATGRQRREIVEAMHERLTVTLAIDAVKVCYHVDADKCACRKPKPGMLTEAAREHGIDLSQSFIVGDRWRDIEAGQAAGCRAFFVDAAYAEKRPEKPYVAVKSLSEAVAFILQSIPRKA